MIRIHRSGAGLLRKDLDAWPLVVALAPEYRRCAVYVLFGLVLIPLIAWWVNDLRPPEKRLDLRFGVGMNAMLALWAVCVPRWRLRVERRGIARRRLFVWHLYSWEEFAIGRVRDGIDQNTYEFPERYPWDRKLSIGLVAEDDRSAIKEMIRRVWVRPPESEVPAELCFRFSFRETAKFGPEGLSIGQRGKEVSYGWAEVRRSASAASTETAAISPAWNWSFPTGPSRSVPSTTMGGRIVPGPGSRGEPNPEPATITAYSSNMCPATGYSSHHSRNPH